MRTPLKSGNDENTLQRVYCHLHLYFNDCNKNYLFCKPLFVSYDELKTFSFLEIVQ